MTRQEVMGKFVGKMGGDKIQCPLGWSFFPRIS